MAEKKNKKDSNDKKKKVRHIELRISWLSILLMGLLIWVIFSPNGSAPAQKLEWDEVRAMMIAGDVKEVEYVRNENQGRVTLRAERIEKYKKVYGDNLPNRSPQFYFLVSAAFDPETTFEAVNSQIPVGERVKLVVINEEKMWPKVIEFMIWPILMIAMWVFLFRGIGKNMGGGGGGFGGFPFGGNRASKLVEKDKLTITFKDVAGLYGAKDEVVEIVDFLKNPKKYTTLGGKIPKGALLVGPPGTGKTLLAKAVAGEAGVPFFSISGSDFVEMFVGVGASRVRDLFQQAKEKAPCIVFIDEIDAVGRARSNNRGFSSNDERENTLNQLLTEMDGFGTNTGVIVLAATNRVDILDKALLRAGRFDRQIHVDLPELKEREEIFQVHLRGLKLANDFSVEFLAKHTPGFSGADIANVCNEAALTAARKDHKEIEKQDFLDAVDRIIGGLERKGKIITPEEKSSIAHHEAGHATISWLLPNANPLFKVTIVPRGQALGAAWYLPEERQLQTMDKMLDEMCSLIGGRVAEEIVNGQPSTGALNDLERLTKMANAMVVYYGMSPKVGPISFYDSTGQDMSFTNPYSEATAELIDSEVKRLITETHDRALAILTEHKDGFLAIAKKLLEEEVIFAEDVEAILGPRAGAPKAEAAEPQAEQPEAEPQTETDKNE